jgi:hypothetical protein
MHTSWFFRFNHRGAKLPCAILLCFSPLLLFILYSLFLCLSSWLSLAQDGFFSDWFQMVSKTQAAPPHCMTPVPTTTSWLEQEFRCAMQ